jgi:hypothetical protein
MPMTVSRALRIAFDLDGVVADLDAACAAVEQRLFGPEGAGRGEAGAGGERRWRHTWREIVATPEFWSTLAPVEPGAIARLNELSLQHGWEIYFLTHRPMTAGASAQRQTQRWLAAQGFEHPSVIVVEGSKGKVAAALELHYLIDDSPKNCMDVLSDSRSRPVLMLRDGDVRVAERARSLGMIVVTSLEDCFGVLLEHEAGRRRPRLLDRLSRLVSRSNRSSGS